MFSCPGALAVSIVTRAHNFNQVKLFILLFIIYRELRFVPRLTQYGALIGTGIMPPCAACPTSTAVAYVHS
jgi:hypothetical protein